MSGQRDHPLLLALDTGSPLVSVALGLGGKVLAERAVALERSSRQLMALVAEVMAEAGVGPRDLGGVAALAGPGSFTGLRIGLATALGLHQALALPALALPTLQALAAAAPAPETGGEQVVVAAVDALRGEWTAQAFAGVAAELAGARPRALGPMVLISGAELARGAPGPEAGTGGAGAGRTAERLAIGFGLTRLSAPRGPRLVEPGPLAPAALRLAAATPMADWDAAALAAPLYARPPAVSQPRRRSGGVPDGS